MLFDGLKVRFHLEGIGSFVIIVPCSGGEGGRCVVGIRIDDSYVKIFMLAVEIGHEGKFCGPIEGNFDLEDDSYERVCSFVPCVIITVE